MSPSTDPVAFALGVLALWIGAAVLLVGTWIVLAEFCAWRARRRLARAPEAIRLTAPRSLARRLELDVEDVSWGWPDRP